MNYTTQTQNDPHFNEAEINGINNQTHEVLDLFAEELPVQQDMAVSQTKSTTSTISTGGGCLGTVSTIGTLF